MVIYTVIIEGGKHMMTGQVLFFCGVVLLILTIILGVVFLIKKPQYIPGNAIYTGADEQHTQKLHSGYPTNRLTIRRESSQATVPGTVFLNDGTEQLTEAQTDVLHGTTVLQDTELLDEQRTEKLENGTIPLSEETTPLQPFDKTVRLNDTAESPDDGTVVLDSTFQTGDTEDISRTTPLSET